MTLNKIVAAVATLTLTLSISLGVQAQHCRWTRHCTGKEWRKGDKEIQKNVTFGDRSESHGTKNGDSGDGEYYSIRSPYSLSQKHRPNTYDCGHRYYAHRYHNSSRYVDGCRRTSLRHFRKEWH